MECMCYPCADDPWQMADIPGGTNKPSKNWQLLWTMPDVELIEEMQ